MDEVGANEGVAVT